MSRPPSATISRRSSRILPADAVNRQMLATPHAGLSFTRVGSRSMYALKMNKMSQAELEKLVFRRVVGGNEEKVDFNEALKEAGFGKFQILLTLTCGLIYLTCSASATTLSFTLPASQCDLSLSSADMGTLNTSPLIGMIIGTFIWGPLSDTRGRRITLLVCLMIDLLATIASSFSINKWVLLSARFINGLGIIGATSLVFAYMGEFLTNEYRENFLFLLELFYNFGVVFIPSLSWVILPLPINIHLGGTFYYHSWNLFTLATGIPGLLSIILLSTLPESPKFLLTRGDVIKTIKILKQIFMTNTRRGFVSYPIIVRTDDPQFSLYFGMKYISNKGYFKELLEQYRNLFGRTTKRKVIQLCLIDFFVNFSYMSLIIWIPELLHRRTVYLEHINNKNSTTLCFASYHLNSEDNKHISPEFCVQTITTDVYIHTLIICATCIPSTILLYFALLYVPKKVLIVVLLCISGSTTLALSFVHGDDLLLSMFCLFEASSTFVETILFVCAVELLPSDISGIALATTVTSGRIAAVLGNILIGQSVDSYCDFTLYIMAASFFSGAIVAITLPTHHIPSSLPDIYH